MSIVRRRDWDPFTWVEDLFEDLPFTFRPLFAPVRTRALMPAVDVYETDDSVVVEADLPGIRKEDIELSVLENRLTISGSMRREREVSGEGYYRRERQRGRFERTITLPVEVQAEKAKATFVDGVLTITIPKAPQARVKGRRIAIE